MGSNNYIYSLFHITTLGGFVDADKPDIVDLEVEKPKHSSIPTIDGMLAKSEGNEVSEKAQNGDNGAVITSTPVTIIEKNCISTS